MKELIVIGYQSTELAEAARSKLLAMSSEYLVEVSDAVVATVNEKGKIKLNQMVNLWAAGAAGGSFWGLLIGVLFFHPLFGVVVGTIIVSFASTIGATLAFLSARFVLRDWVQGKFGTRLRVIDDGLQKDGAFYVFTLRLIPVFPFFVINLLMGLTRIKTPTFFWVSQLGMLPATIVFVNAGTQISRIESPAGLLSPALIASFAALAFFPWAAKGIVALLKRGRA